MKSRGLWIRRVALALLAALLLGGVELLSFYPIHVQAAQFSMRELKMSDSLAGATAAYTLSFAGQSAGSISSIRLQFCSNDPFPGQACTIPAGLNVATATLSTQLGMTGFTVSPATTANELILTRATPIATVVGSVSYAFGNIHNPTNEGTLYARLETFASTDATGASHDAGGLAVSYLQNALSIQTYVPPYLLFCVANTIQGQDCETAQGNYIDFGDFSTTKTSVGQTQMVVATNAEFGFLVAMQGTTMTSGTNVIPAMTAPDVSRAGVSQFGLNLRANSTPSAGQDPQGLGLSAVVSSKYNQQNFYAFGSGDVLVQATDPDIAKYTVTYVTNIDKSQAAGVYVSTLTYITTASF